MESAAGYYTYGRKFEVNRLSRFRLILLKVIHSRWQGCRVLTWMFCYSKKQQPHSKSHAVDTLTLGDRLKRDAGSVHCQHVRAAGVNSGTNAARIPSIDHVGTQYIDEMFDVITQRHGASTQQSTHLAAERGCRLDDGVSVASKPRVVGLLHRTWRPRCPRSSSSISISLTPRQFHDRNEPVEVPELQQQEVNFIE